jgi:hypothetical protein
MMVIGSTRTASTNAIILVAINTIPELIQTRVTLHIPQECSLIGDRFLPRVSLEAVAVDDMVTLDSISFPFSFFCLFLSNQSPPTSKHLLSANRLISLKLKHLQPSSNSSPPPQTQT